MQFLRWMAAGVSRESRAKSAGQGMEHVQSVALPQIQSGRQDAGFDAKNGNLNFST